MRFSFILFFLFLHSQIFAQTSIYVSVQTGSDNTGNGTIGNPYQTIKKGVEAADALTGAVNVWVRSGTYQNSNFSTTITDIWKDDEIPSTAVRLNNINGAPNAYITIKPYTGEHPLIQGDGDNCINIRNCSYLRLEGFEIKGIVDFIPLSLAWQHWGTYKYLQSGSWFYGDRAEEIKTTYNIPAVLANQEYVGLPNINSLNVIRPKLFVGKGVLVNLSHHIDIVNNEIHHFPGGGLRVTQSDYVNITGNTIHHTTSRASVGTHGLVLEGLEPDSGDNLAIQKAFISGNTVYSNYNELYSWVQSKTICSTAIDEGKGICLLRTAPIINNFNGFIRVENNICYDNGKSGIHCNDIAKAEIVNNTVYGNAHTNIYNASISAGTNAGISIQSSTDIKILNNITVVTSGLSPALIALSQGQNCTVAAVSNNLVLGGGTSDFVGGYTVSNPLFVNMATNNVQLQVNSPAINNGMATGAATTDFAGNARVGTPDIGAYEYVAPFSIELVDFSIHYHYNDVQNVQLTWTTTSEINNDFFTVEKSQDAKNWGIVGSTKGLGNNNNSANYSLIDSFPFKGISYYRLKQTNFDGTFSYSDILLANVDLKNTIYPNPFSTHLKIFDLKQNENISVWDINGKNQTNEISIYFAPSFAKLDFQNVAEGIYFIKFGNKIEKVVKKATN